MILNIFFIVLAVLSLAFIIIIIARKLSRLKNINVNHLPDIQAQRQKDIILKNRLQRLVNESFDKVKDLAAPSKEKVNNIFKKYYQKLKDVEKELKIKGHQKLTSSVDKSRALDESIIEAKQLLNQEEYKQAEEALLDILSLDPHNVEVYKLLAEVYRCNKEYVQAKETLEYLLRLTHNEDPDVFHSLADIAKARGNLKQAEEDYLKSISLSEDNYLYFLSLAEVYQDLEENEKALEIAQRALILSSNNPKILDFLINISIIMQDKELAIQYLDKLKEVNPENNKIVDFSKSIDSLE